MNSDKLKQVNKLLESGFSLERIGVNNWAFSKEDSLNILEQLEELQISILGGDVLELTNSTLKHNYDNWYCDRLPNEKDFSYVQRSLSTAREFIKNYIIIDRDNYFFSFVIEGKTYEIEVTSDDLL